MINFNILELIEFNINILFLYNPINTKKKNMKRRESLLETMKIDF